MHFVHLQLFKGGIPKLTGDQVKSHKVKVQEIQKMQ